MPFCLKAKIAKMYSQVGSLRLRNGRYLILIDYVGMNTNCNVSTVHQRDYNLTFTYLLSIVRGFANSYKL